MDRQSYVLIGKVSQIGCGIPLGSSENIRVVCRFPSVLCSSCRSKFDELISMNPIVWVALIRELSELYDDAELSPPHR